MNYYADVDGNIYNENDYKLKLCPDTHGYLQFTQHLGNKKKKSKSVHRFVYEYFYGEIPSHLEIDHINKDKTDNRLENLRLVTPIENNRHRDYVKLTEEKVRDIRCKYAQGDTSYRKLAKEYNVHFTHIGDIINFKMWL